MTTLTVLALVFFIGYMAGFVLATLLVAAGAPYR